MELDALLCDFAQVADGKLFISGGAINVIWALGSAPYGVNVHVAIVVRVPYTATNENHTVTLRLIDADGRPVSPWHPDPVVVPAPVELATGFTVGRPPTLPPGEVQLVPLVFGIQAPVADLGLYEFSIAIDDDEVKRVPIRISGQPA